MHWSWICKFFEYITVNTRMFTPWKQPIINVVFTVTEIIDFNHGIWCWVIIFLLLVTTGKEVGSSKSEKWCRARGDNDIHFAFLSTGFQSQVELQQFEAELVRPGSSVNLSFKDSLYTLSSSWVNWVKQSPGQCLEWIVQMNLEMFLLLSTLWSSRARPHGLQAHLTAQPTCNLVA